MYNIYGTSNKENGNNYGSFRLEYNDPPIVFEPGTKIALLSLMTWNNIYNISAERKNNVFWVLKNSLANTSATDYTEIEATAYRDSKYIGVTEGGSNRTLYRIELPDGQYSIESLDEEISLRLNFDPASGITGDISLDQDSAREFLINANETYNKVDFVYDANSSNGYDVIFPVSDSYSPAEKSILNFLGLQKIAENSGANYTKTLTLLSSITADRTIATGKTETWTGGSRTFYSLNKYHLQQYSTPLTASHRLAPDVADVNNGITNLNLRLRNNVIDGGKEPNHGGPSDILYSFNITSAPSYPQNDNPPNLIWLDVKAVNTPITQLFFEFTDQNGTPLGTNMADESSFTLVVKSPEEDLSNAIATLTDVIKGISAGR